MLERVKDTHHVGEHLGPSELRDDEVVGEERVAKGFGRAMRVRVLKELKGEFRVFLLSEERAEPERRY